ncbi:dynein axonemal assembly factor 6 [Phymastichus coffea]|uniref:dynein axonemal assembly factor 6 n=1 Tax=Phymastichus coffea TaxID=108790 RepID=UPI00273C66C3|nr:dynein axonemal assembly factor 6 [Phymastichus coffea]
MEGFTVQQIKDLQQLVCPPKEDSDSDSDDGNLRQRLSRQKICPSDIGKAACASSSEAVASAKAAQIVSNSDIWHPSEANISAALLSEDPRTVPEYQMKFKQAVGTEDIFLGMNLKTPATASCEWMSLLVRLPGEQRERVELSVEADVVDLRSPRYRLQLPTPHPVDPNGSSAKWHSDSECLEITLKLTRELDDVNF